MMSKDYADRASGGIFLIGLALLFLTGYWWPGILFVIGASSIARGIAEGRSWYTAQGGLWMIGLGIVFAFGFSIPLLLILIGVTSLLGYGWHQYSDDDGDDDNIVFTEKPKHDEELIVDPVIEEE